MECIVYLEMENDVSPVRVTAVEHLHHRLYQVVFEDGYQNMFFTDVQTGEWIEEDLGKTTLAAALGEKLLQLQEGSVSSPAIKRLSWCRASIADMVVNFGYYSYAENSRTIFEVYGVNHKFLCNLVKSKKGRWVMFGNYREIKEYQYTNQLHVIISLLEGMADADNA
jgi:hypothetical protein